MLASLVLLCIFSISSVHTSASNTSERFPFFSDVSLSHKNFNAITNLMHEGTIGGYPDGTFLPDKPVSRAEALKILLLGSNINSPEITSGTKPFSDVNTSEWFAKYVAEAKKRGIVSGKGNTGKFAPAQSVNRAEALKMMLLVNEIKESAVEEDLYADVLKDDWFATYFQDAKWRGIFTTPKTENIYPAGILTRGDLVEMMYRFQKHEENKTSERIGKASWYKGKTDNTTEYTAAHRTLAKGSKLKVTDFDTGKSVVVTINDRGPYLPNRILDLSDEAFEEISSLGKGITTIKMEEVDASTPNGPIAQKNSAPKGNFLPKNSWDGITLDTDIYPVFRKGEVHTFTGTSSGDVVTATLKNKQGKTSRFVAPVKNGRFSVEVFFAEPGQEEIGFLSGRSGSYSIYPVQIFSGSQNVSSSEVAHPAPQNFSASFHEGKLLLNWDDPNNTLFAIQFRQKGKEKNIFVMGKNSVSVPTQALDRFERGNLFISIQGAKTVSNDSLTLETPFGGMDFITLPVYERFPESVTPGVEITSATWEYDGTISVKGKVSGGITLGKGYILNTKEELFEKPLVITGNNSENFSLSFTPKKKDFYVAEITDTGGRALAIVPITPRGYFPILPSILERDTSVEVKVSVSDVLNRINTFRQENGRAPLTEDNIFSELAQVRAEDMNERNYFAHVTPGGKTVNDFRIDLGVKVPLFENIAINSESSLQAAYSLEFSPTHRKNLLNKDVKRVGIGIEERSNGDIILVQLFGGNKLSELSLDTIQQNVSDQIKSINPQLSENSVLNNLTQDWANIMAEKRSAEFSFSSGESWSNLLKKYQIQRATEVFIASFPSEIALNDFLQNNQESFINTITNKSSFGASLAVSQEGVFFLCLVGEQ